MRDLRNKVIVITGASSGIGYGVAEEFAKEGMRLTIAARNIDKLNEMIPHLKELGAVDVLAVKTDVTKEEDCKNLIDKTVERFGGIDILVNNAGISMRAMFKDLHLDVIRNLMNVNFWGTVYCTKYALPSYANLSCEQIFD